MSNTPLRSPTLATTGTPDINSVFSRSQADTPASAAIDPADDLKNGRRLIDVSFLFYRLEEVKHHHKENNPFVRKIKELIKHNPREKCPNCFTIVQ